MVDIQRPPGVNVGVNNPGTIVYVTGNESTDGSIRYEIVDFNGNPVAEIQERAGGVWSPASLKTGPNSVIVGTVLSLSAAGGNLITLDNTDLAHFHARSATENGVTTTLANIVNAIEFFEHVIFRSDDSTEFTGTLIENQVLGNAIHLITEKFFFKTGSTAATQPVRIQAWDGIGDGGTLIFDQTYPFVEIPKNSEIGLALEGFLEFAVGADTFTRITSDADFSLLTNPAKDAWWLAVDLSTIKNDDLLQTVEWVAGDDFTKGDWSTQDRKVYECNVTGIQTGEFTDNLDKWDQLISKHPIVSAELFLAGNATQTLIPVTGAMVEINTDTDWTSDDAIGMTATPDGAVEYIGDRDTRAAYSGNINLNPATAMKSLSIRAILIKAAVNVVTFTNAGNLINEIATPLSDGDLVSFRDTAGTLPSTIRADVVYFVVNKLVDSFQIAFTAGGGAIPFADDGSGTNSYKAASLEGANPTLSVQAITPADMIPQAIVPMSTNDKAFIVIINNTDAVDILVNSGYQRYNS